ncbi:MAG: amidohydrolase [Armatimonadetes bacterium]|nr:amidohydrolase [Armatimonadota bacterium]
MEERLFVQARFLPSLDDVNAAQALFRRLGAAAQVAPVPARADAIIVRDGRIIALGDARGLARRAPDAERIDLRTRTLLPGLVDSHCHLVSYGLAWLAEADLAGARSLAEVQARLRAHATATGIRPGDGRWLLGRGFDQDAFAERRWPTRADLDAVSTEIPIRITRICGHALVVNTPALNAAVPDASLSRVGEGTSGPDSLIRGIFTENAMAPVCRAIPPPTDEIYLQAARHATRAAAAAGFTGVHCLVASEQESRALQRLAEAGDLPVRVRLQLASDMLPALRSLGLATGFGDDRLRIGAIKLFADGSLGARTAALHEPYADDPGNRGTLHFTQEELDARVQAVADAGCQVAVHAIGDRALDAVLTAFERCRGLPPRPRVEHASFCPPPLLERMARLNVVAAVQPQFVASDWWTPERLGPQRARWVYPFRTMLQQGIPLAGGTDCPVERLNALQALGRAVHRDGRLSEERLTLDEAVAIFTEGAAYAAGEEAEAGRLAPGCRADFVVLEADPRAVPAAEIERIPVAMTVVGGEIVHGG